ncbi:hypothetical protein BGZ57DRAFT_935950 [Hyaloscypha finlandica]|nr:hypothetical protein BGZ57DRAFT_935950 [Hyaloscypha finlandica]
MAKHKSGLGLEMPLNIISGLAGSKYTNEFNGKTFIKGFSAMLIATEVSKDLLLWHYYFNVTGERISYLDHDLKTIEAIRIATIPYGDIGSIYLPEPHADYILEKISLSCGKLISGGVSFALGVHHIPPHLTRNSYLEKLAWIATRFVVFWDERDKRG